MKNFFKSLFAKKEEIPESPIGQYFNQNTVFAHSELVGDKKIMRMDSGNIYLAELIEINDPGGHGADDTAIRDLVWKVLDIVKLEDDPGTLTKTITCPRYGSIQITQQMINADAHRDVWAIANDMFIKYFFPEQIKSFRFLRG